MADGHRATRVVKHESEIFPFSDLQMIEDEFNQGRPFGLLVNVENVTRIVQKSYLEIESALSNGIQDLHSMFAKQVVHTIFESVGLWENLKL